MQGTDYYVYNYLYDLEYPLDLVIEKQSFLMQFEFLYCLSASVFKSIGLPFVCFVAAINLFNLIMIDKFLQRFSYNKLISLIILYFVYGIVIMESTLRQSIAMSIILGISFVALSDRNFKKILIGSIFAFLFHKSSIFASFFIIVMYFVEDKFGYETLFSFMKKNIVKIMVCVSIFSLLAVIIPYDELFKYIPGSLGFKIQLYFSNANYSIISIGLRLYLLITAIYLISKEMTKFEYNDFLVCLFYIFGMMFYFVFCKFAMISRVTIYFEILEIAIFANLLNNVASFKNVFNKLVLLLYCCVITLLCVKDGIATQNQSNYKNRSIICPYYNIFNQEKALENMGSRE